ncbi:hypothetical protein T03_13131 [Trichinella britovi]|uniref:Uncharacterized protein n=1 Tax=Trichinella britovi TaxID=45882 RepID=A0A0V1D426_TRIBR|nr:hypothetical protein T03_13131 [Trichinella britovi]
MTCFSILLFFTVFIYVYCLRFYSSVSFKITSTSVGVKFNKLCYVNLKIRTPCHTVVCQNSGSICYVDLRMLCYITHKAKHSLKVYYRILRHDASKHALEMLQLEIRISIKHAQLVQKIFYKILKIVYEFIVCLGSIQITEYEFHLKSQLFTFLSSISMKILPTFNIIFMRLLLLKAVIFSVSMNVQKNSPNDGLIFYSKSLVYENVGAEQQQVSVAGDALMISLRCSCCNALAIDSQMTVVMKKTDRLILNATKRYRMSWEEAGLQVTTSIEQQQQTKDWPLPTAGQQFLTAPPSTRTATAISYKTLANRLLTTADCTAATEQQQQQQQQQASKQSSKQKEKIAIS